MARKTKQAEPAAGEIPLAPVTNLPAVIPGEPAASAVDPPLIEIAARINAEFTAVDAAEVTAQDHRIQAGRMLKTARDTLSKNAFLPWCKRYIKRSKADIYACLKLVESDKPEDQQAAREAQKTRSATSMAASRQRQSATLQTEPAVPVGLDLTQPDNLAIGIDALRELATKINKLLPSLEMTASQSYAIAGAVIAAKQFLSILGKSVGVNPMGTTSSIYALKQAKTALERTIIELEYADTRLGWERILPRMGAIENAKTAAREVSLALKEE